MAAPRYRLLKLADRVLASSAFRAGRIPFIGPIPALVLVFGLLAALAITSIGIVQLKLQSDEAATMRSELIAATLAERLATVSDSARIQIIERAALRSGAEIILVERSGTLVADGSVRAPSTAGILQLLEVRSGETQTSLGRSRFFSAEVPSTALNVLTFVPAPRRPQPTTSLIQVVAAFTLILLGVAALVAFALAKDVQLDVAYVKKQIVEIADSGSPGGTPVLVRSVDQLGALTCAFNDLVERFARGEARYKDDLRLAAASERDRSEFLAALSHELKTPLNVILGFADVLLAEVEGPLSPDAVENLTVVRRSGHHLKALIKDILDLSALESGELTLSRKLTNLHNIADEVCRENQVAATEKGLRLILTGKPLSVWADPLRVHQIIGNLVGNAIKFTHEGEVTVRVEGQPNGAAVIVQDTGPGIAQREQSTIFEDYAQVGDTRARGAGSGLGLAITRRLLSMHDGEIHLESQLGHGAKFTVILPTKQRGQSKSREKIQPSSPVPSPRTEST